MGHAEPRYIQLELVLAYVASVLRGSDRLLSIKGSPELILASAVEFMPWTDQGEQIVFESEIPCLAIWEEESEREDRGAVGESVDVRLQYVARFDAGGLETPARTWGRRWVKETRWVALQAIARSFATLSDGTRIDLCPAGSADIIESIRWRESTTFCAQRPEGGGDGVCGWEASLTLSHAHPPFPLADPPAFLKILFDLHPEALSPDNVGPIVSGEVKLT